MRMKTAMTSTIRDFYHLSNDLIHIQSIMGCLSKHEANTLWEYVKMKSRANTGQIN